MPPKWTDARIASALYVLPILAVAGIWYILVTDGKLSFAEFEALFREMMVDSYDRRFFWWLILLPALCLGMSLAYLSTVGSSKKGALALLGAGFIVALASWLRFDSSIAIFATLPLVFGWRVARRHLTTRSTGP
jgi:hypothetical protein